MMTPVNTFLGVKYSEYGFQLDGLRAYLVAFGNLRSALGIDDERALPEGLTEGLRNTVVEKLSADKVSGLITLTVSLAEWELMVQVCEEMERRVSPNGYYRRTARHLLAGLHDIELAVRVMDAAR